MLAISIVISRYHYTIVIVTHSLSHIDVDVCKPLIGQHQDAQPVISLPASCPSEAIVDVSENIRAKIYAIFCKIG